MERYFEWGLNVCRDLDLVKLKEESGGLWKCGGRDGVLFDGKRFNGKE